MRHVTPRLLAVVLSFAPVAGAMAQSHEHGHEHDHGHPGAEAPKPKLDHGKKWKSDAPLRKGMEAIKSIVVTNLPRAHAGKMSDAEFEAMGKKVDAELAEIFANCKLAPDADQVLHGVLAQIMQGSRVLRSGEGKRTAGVVQMIKALNEYGTLFEHAGWTDVKH